MSEDNPIKQPEVPRSATLGESQSSRRIHRLLFGGEVRRLVLTAVIAGAILAGLLGAVRELRDSKGPHRTTQVTQASIGGETTGQLIEVGASQQVFSGGLIVTVLSVGRDRDGGFAHYVLTADDGLRRAYRGRVNDAFVFDERFGIRVTAIRVTTGFAGFDLTSLP